MQLIKMLLILSASNLAQAFLQPRTSAASDFQSHLTSQ